MHNEMGFNTVSSSENGGTPKLARPRGAFWEWDDWGLLLMLYIYILYSICPGLSSPVIYIYYILYIWPFVSYIYIYVLYIPYVPMRHSTQDDHSQTSWGRDRTVPHEFAVPSYHCQVMWKFHRSHGGTQSSLHGLFQGENPNSNDNYRGTTMTMETARSEPCTGQISLVSKHFSIGFPLIFLKCGWCIYIIVVIFTVNFSTRRRILMYLGWSSPTS